MPWSPCVTVTVTDSDSEDSTSMTIIMRDRDRECHGESSTTRTVTEGRALASESQLPRLATGRNQRLFAYNVLLIDLCGLFRGRRGRALHLKLCLLFAIVTSKITKRYSCPVPCAGGYDTPAQQREDSITFMIGFQTTDNHDSEIPAHPPAGGPIRPASGARARY